MNRVGLCGSAVPISRAPAVGLTERNLLVRCLPSLCMPGPKRIGHPTKSRPVVFSGWAWVQVFGPAQNGKCFGLRTFSVFLFRNANIFRRREVCETPSKKKIHGAVLLQPRHSKTPRRCIIFHRTNVDVFELSRVLLVAGTAEGHRLFGGTFQAGTRRRTREQAGDLRWPIQAWYSLKR